MFVWITNQHDEYGRTLHIARIKAYFDSAIETKPVLSNSTLEPVAELLPDDTDSKEFVLFVDAARKAGFHICFCDDA